MRSPLPVIGQGDGWIVVAKPPRLLVHRNPKAPRADAALQRVRDQVGCEVYPIHRLDAAASGCLLFATQRRRAGELSSALGVGEKTYVALVRGVCGEPDSVVVNRALEDDNAISKSATTAFVCLGRCEQTRCSLVMARPQTGRYHQIRRHLRGLSHPIIGDRAHGDSHVNRWWRQRGMDRLGLHCVSMRLKLPMGESIEVDCPLFDDLWQSWTCLTFWDEVVDKLPPLAASPLILGDEFRRLETAP